MKNNKIGGHATFFQVVVPQNRHLQHETELRIRNISEYISLYLQILIFDKDAKETQCEKNCLFNNLLEQLDTHI